MMQKFRKLSLESQLFFSFMAVSVCLLLLSLSITLSSTITRQRQEIDKNISALAAYVASMDSVVSMLENGYPDGSANEALDSLSENFPDLNVIAIYNTTGLRFYHTNGGNLRRRRGGGNLKGKPALYHHRLRYKRFPAAGFPFDPE